MKLRNKLAPRYRRKKRVATKRLARALPLRFLGQFETLEDRRVLAANALAFLDGEINTPSDVSEFTLDIQQSSDPVVLGIRVTGTGGSLNPDSPTAFRGTTGVPTVLSEADSGGTLNGVLIAEFSPGEHSIFVDGQSGTGTFKIEVFLPGDLDGSGGLSDQEILEANAAYVQDQFGGNYIAEQFYRQQGIDFSQDLYRSEFDINMNGQIDEFDIEQIEANQGGPNIILELIGDMEAPEIQVGLDTDSGTQDDGITNDVTGDVIVGTISDVSDITFFRASVDSMSPGDFVDVSFSPGGSSFAFSVSELEALAGNNPVANNGPHTLYLIGGDDRGNQHGDGPEDETPVAFTFQLDTVVPDAPTLLDLADLSDAGVDGEGISNSDDLTNIDTPTFSADAETDSLVKFFSSLDGLLGSDVANSPAQIVSSSLSEGTHQITATATDIAGNTSATSSALQVEIDLTDPTPLSLDLADVSDDGSDGDHLTTITTVTLEGITEPGIRVELNTGAQTTSDGTTGAYSFSGIALPFGDTEFTVTATDDSGNISTVMETFTRNNAPVVDDQPFSVDENTVNGVSVGTIVATDQNVTNAGDAETLTFTVTGGTGQSVFDVDPSTGEITVADSSALDKETNDEFTLEIEVSDIGGDGAGGDGLSGTATITIGVDNVDEAPTIDAGQSFSLPENSAVSTSVGTVTADDEDVGDDPVFAITGGNTGDAFQIDSSTGEITVKTQSALDLETNSPFSLTVEVSDSDNAALKNSATVTVTLTNVDEAPTIDAGQSFSIAENSVVDTSVGTVTADDQDVGDDPVFAITGGNTGGAFQINASTGAITVKTQAALDRETNSPFSLTVEVSDSDNSALKNSATVTVTLTNVDEAPTIDAGQSFSLPENSAVDTSVGTVTADDQDVGDDPVFAITGGNTGDAFKIDASTGEIKVKTQSALDLETNSPFSLTVEVSDSDNVALKNSATVTVTLTNVDEAPTIDSGQMLTIDPTEADGAEVGTVAADDPDAGDDPVFSITGGTGQSLFDIDSSTGVVTVPDISLIADGEDYTIDVQVEDADTGTLNNSASVLIKVRENSVTAINDAFGVAPTITEGSVDVQLDVLDNDSDDEGETFKVIAAGTDLIGSQGGSITIDLIDGLFVTYTPLTDFAGVETFDYTIADTLGATDTATVTVTVTNVNDTPTVANMIVDQTATEDDAFNFTVPANTFDDVDTGDTLTLTADLSSGSALPSWLSFDGSAFTGTPLNDDVGELMVRVTATDDSTAMTSVSDIFKITVANANDTPTVENMIVDQNATEDDAFNFTVPANTFDDVDTGDTLTLTADLSGGSALPSWLSFDGSAFTGTPLNDDVGELMVRVTATDDSTAMASISDIFKITVANANDAPTVANVIVDQTATEDDAFNFTVPANTFDDVDTGDTLTLTADLSGGSALPSWLSFDGSEFTGTPLNGDVGELMVRVTATDDSTAMTSVSDVFKITVENTNDAPTVENMIPDQVAEQFALFGFTFSENAFDDVDVSDTLTYSATLNDDSPLPDWLSFDPGTRTFSGTPSVGDEGDVFVKVTATDDGSPSENISDTFKIAVSVAPSVEIALVIRQDPTGTGEFTFFVANPGAGAEGIGRFRLTSNGSDSLHYSLAALDAFDLDGTKTAGDATDNVTSLSFRNAANSVVFDILTDPDRDIDAAAGTVSGIWGASEGLTPLINALRDGDLFVRLQTSGGDDVKVAGKNINPSAELDILPVSISEVLVGQSYTVEVWAKDILPTSTGLTNVDVDINYLTDRTTGNSLSNNGPFDFATSGSINNITGTIESLGGGTVFAGVGVDPAFARVGFVDFSATADGDQLFTLTYNSLRRQGSADPLPGSDVELINRSITHVAPSQFNVLSSSTVTVGGTVQGNDLLPQAPGGDATTADGTMDVVVNDFVTLSEITFVSASIDLDINVNGPFLPDAPGGATAADFGFVTDGTATNIAVRDIVVDASSSLISISSGSFGTDEIDLTLSSGTIDVPGSLGTTPFDISGLSLVFNGAANSTLTEVSAGVFEVTIPLMHTISLDAQFGGGSELTVTGTITAQFGAPLSASEGSSQSDPEAAFEGTGVFTTLVEHKTATDAQGQVASLPQSEDWIDEWDSYWVEVWVRTTEGQRATSATVDLSYDQRYITATGIQHGDIYRIDTTGAIDDSAGLIEGFGGVSIGGQAGADGYALVGRVRFEPLADNQVEFDPASGSYGPYSSGIELLAAQIDVDGTAANDVVLGDAPDTELWAVVYDTDDNDRIDFGDLSYFAASFQQNVLQADSAMTETFDFDRSGRVDFGDMTFLASNFLLQKGSNAELLFPESFQRRWIGTGLETTGDTSVGDLLDSAVATWQDILGTDSPIDIQLVVNDLGGLQLGSAQILEVDAQGRPIRGRVTLDDDAAGQGWYADLNDPSGSGQYDLYTTLLHEVGHALGFTQAYSGFSSYVEHNEGQVQFVGSGFTANLDDAGLHLNADSHPDDVMNPMLAPGQRKLPSALDAQILLAAYDAASGSAHDFDSTAAALTAFEFSSIATAEISLQALPLDPTSERGDLRLDAKAVTLRETHLPPPAFDFGAPGLGSIFMDRLATTWSSGSKHQQLANDGVPAVAAPIEYRQVQDRYSVFHEAHSVDPIFDDWHASTMLHEAVESLQLSALPESEAADDVFSNWK